MAFCIDQNESDAESLSYKPGFALNYNSSSTLNLSNNDLKSGSFCLSSKREKLHMPCLRNKTNNPDYSLDRASYKTNSSNAITSSPSYITVSASTQTQKTCSETDFKNVVTSVKNKQRSLSPTSTAERCRIAIVGCGNLIAIEGHAGCRK